MKGIFFATAITFLIMSYANGKIINNKNAMVQQFEKTSLRELCTLAANYYTESTPIRIDKFVVLIQATGHKNRVQLVKQIDPINEKVKRDYPFMLKDTFLTSDQYMNTVNDVEKKTLCGSTLAPIIFKKGGTFHVQYMNGDRKTLFNIVIDKNSCK